MTLFPILIQANLQRYDHFSEVLKICLVQINVKMCITVKALKTPQPVLPKLNILSCSITNLHTSDDFSTSSVPRKLENLSMQGRRKVPPMCK